MAQKVRTHLEMTGPNQLRPSRQPPAPVTVEATDDPKLLQSTYEPIATLYDWPPFDEWATGFTKPGRHYFLIRIDGVVAGLVKFIDHGEGDVQLDNFGLLADFIGKGYGGAALVETIRHGWGFAGGTSGTRIWLHTSSADHSHALAHYKARGFVITHTEPA